MQLDVPPDLESLLNKRLSSGQYSNVEDVLRDALEAQDAQSTWSDEEVSRFAEHIEAGYQQAERGELIGGSQAREQIQTLKQEWRQSRSASLPKR